MVFDAVKESVAPRAYICIAHTQSEGEGFNDSHAN